MKIISLLMNVFKLKTSVIQEFLTIFITSHNVYYVKNIVFNDIKKVVKS